MKVKSASPGALRSLGPPQSAAEEPEEKEVGSPLAGDGHRISTHLHLPSGSEMPDTRKLKAEAGAWEEAGRERVYFSARQYGNIGTAS